MTRGRQKAMRVGGTHGAADAAPRVEVSLSLPGQSEGEARGFTALIGTGTQGSLITGRVIDALNPPRCGDVRLDLLDGTRVASEEFRLAIRLKRESTDPARSDAGHSDPVECLVARLPEPHDGPMGACDVLLGMDFLRRCRLEAHGTDGGLRADLSVLPAHTRTGV